MSTRQRRLPVEREALPGSIRGLRHSSAIPASLSRAGIGTVLGERCRNGSATYDYSCFAYPAMARSRPIGALLGRCPINMLAVTSAPADPTRRIKPGSGDNSIGC